MSREWFMRRMSVAEVRLVAEARGDEMKGVWERLRWGMWACVVPHVRKRGLEPRDLLEFGWERDEVVPDVEEVRGMMEEIEAWNENR